MDLNEIKLNKYYVFKINIETGERYGVALPIKLNDKIIRSYEFDHNGIYKGYNDRNTETGFIIGGMDCVFKGHSKEGNKFWYKFREMYQTDKRLVSEHEVPRLEISDEGQVYCKNIAKMLSDTALTKADIEAIQAGKTVAEMTPNNDLNDENPYVPHEHSVAQDHLDLEGPGLGTY